MIDSHIHIDAKAYAELGGVEKILFDARAVGVTRMVAPALELDSFESLRTLASRHPTIYPAVGIHPHEVTELRCDNLKQDLEKSLSKIAVPILGETGLECHYDFVPLELQLESFRAHLEIAKSHGVPIILHCREAEELLYKELKRASLPRSGVVHCFTGNWEWAQRFLDLGYYIGITGVVTFKKSTQVQEVARLLPQDRLLVETDGPYLAPIPYRGKTNKPEYIPLIVEKIAELRDCDKEFIAAATVKNTEEIFGLPKTF